MIGEVKFNRSQTMVPLPSQSNEPQSSTANNVKPEEKKALRTMTPITFDMAEKVGKPNTPQVFETRSGIMPDVIT